MKKEINVVLGERVKNARRARGMTREQLAERIDVSVRFLADVEGGAAGVSLSTLKQLCDALFLSADHLIGNDDAPSKNEYAAAAHALEQIPLEQLPFVESILHEISKMVERK